MLFEDVKIYSLYIEGAAEDMVNSSLSKLQAPEHLIQFFLQKVNGKILFKPQDVSALYIWIRDQGASVNNLKRDYLNYLKYFSNIPLHQFESYINWTEKIHAKVDEANFLNRHKEIKDIELGGQDKENIIANDNDVLILKGDDEHKCVRYGKGYTFCISRPGGGNMFGKYRLTKSSTFYFIFFKNIPKSDPRHILVLDRTRDGYEWTFADNRTRTVSGGWSEVVKTFPLLAKYERYIVNKPLTKEEEDYSQKEKHFIQNPTLSNFNAFSYKEKANVLKYGSSIPLDIFLSLDKFLRNEWVGVGPSMTADIYDQLTPPEINRFIPVRKQVLLNSPAVVNQFDFDHIINRDKEFKLQVSKEASEYIENRINYTLTRFLEEGEKTDFFIGADPEDEEVEDHIDLSIVDDLPDLSSLNGKVKNFTMLGSSVVNLEGLPEGIERLYLSGNKLLKSLRGMPQSVNEFYCKESPLISLEEMSKNVTYLNLEHVPITTLKSIPNGVEILEIYSEYLTDLRGLPQSVKNIDITQSERGNITSLEGLPEGLEGISLYNFKSLKNLKGVPRSVKNLSCTFCGLTSLEGAPIGLEYLTVAHCKLTDLQFLPQSVKSLDCGFNPLTSLEGIPADCEYIAYGVDINKNKNKEISLEKVNVTTLLKTYLLIT